MAREVHGRRTGPLWGALAAALLLVGLLSWLLWPPSKPAKPADLDGGGAGSPRYSNVRQTDYVGPKSCGDCHEERLGQWREHLHSKMNQMASKSGALLGNFEDFELRYAGGRMRADHSASGEPRMQLIEGAQVRSYRITRTIGSRYLQEYVGIQTEGPEPPEHPVYQTELRLPFGYLLRSGRWLHQQYFDSWYESEYDADNRPSLAAFDPEQSPWRGRCAWCHNTYSFDKRLARLDGETQVGAGIELLFADQKRNSIEQLDGAHLLEVEELVTVGISCESCHFGGREHAEGDRDIRFQPQGEGIVANPSGPLLAGTREDARTVNAICAQCHSAPTLLFPNGAGTRNSSEALDLLSGACATRIKCTDCHDPHVQGPGAMSAPQEKHLQACTACHQNLQPAQAQREHSKHGSEVSCLDCHMPRMVQGLDTLIRSHRISSPDDPVMLTRSLNACNLCHLDKSPSWTGQILAERHDAKIEGPLSTEPAARLWLGSDERILRLSAAGALRFSERGRAFLPELLSRLNDPVAYDRLRYFWAVEGVLGRPLSDESFRVDGPPALRQQQAEELLELVAP